MHANWYAAGLKALMGNLGRELYQQLEKGARTETDMRLFRKLQYKAKIDNSFI